jgi:DNA-binding NarL/FixJ family response regulator
MTEVLKSVIFNVATGELTERALTADELSDYAAVQEQEQVRQAEVDAKATARESALAKLKALGLTQAEISAL